MHRIPIFITTDKNLLQTKYVDFVYKVDDNNYDSFCEQVYKISECKNINHIEISELGKTYFGRGLTIDSLKIFTNKIVSPESIFYGSIIGKENKKNHSLYKKSSNFVKSIRNQFINKETFGINLFGYKFDKEYEEDLFDVIYWMAIEDTVQKLSERLFICDKFNVNYFTNSQNEKEKCNCAKSFSKYYIFYKQKKNVWENITNIQKDFVKIIKESNVEKKDFITKKSGKMDLLF